MQLTDLVAAQNDTASPIRQQAIQALMSKGISPDQITGDALQRMIMELGSNTTTQVPIDDAIEQQLRASSFRPGGVAQAPGQPQQVTAANSQQQNAPPPAPMQKPQLQSAAEEAAEGAASNAAEESQEMPTGMSASDAARYASMPEQQAAGPQSSQDLTMVDQGQDGFTGGEMALLAAIMGGTGAALSPRIRAAAMNVLKNKTAMPSVGVPNTPATAFGAGNTVLRGGATSAPTAARGPRQASAADLGLTASGGDANAELMRLVREFSQGKPAMDGPLLRAIKLQEGQKRARAASR